MVWASARMKRRVYGGGEELGVLRLEFPARFWA